MDDLQQWYRDRLSSRIEALKAAKKELLKGNPEVKESIKRIAHSLRGSGATYGFPQITAAGTELEEASDEVIQKKMEKLIDVLSQIASKKKGRDIGLLIIDDDPSIYRLLQKKLAASNRKIYVADNARKAEKVLEEHEISLVILDLVLPDDDGRNLLARLRQNHRTALIPVIVLSAKMGAQPKTECFALGADDYFEKPFDPDALASTVSVKLEEISEISRVARHDVLTGLPNRIALRESFRTLSALSVRQHQTLCVSIIDLDHFKSVNDTYGHDMGDEVLRRVASILSTALRKADIAARWGGEEFVVLFPDTDITGAKNVLGKVLRHLRNDKFQTGDGQTFHVTFSAGVIQVAKSASLEQSVSQADQFLYQAKAAGRNRIMSKLNSVSDKKKKILLAEDDNLTASPVIQRLTREGFEVIHFTDGAEAFNGAPESGVSLVILDVNMPGMNGFEVLKKLRNKLSYRDIPIIILTAMGKEEYIVRGFELGADDYIQKPFSLAELASRVSRLLTTRR